MFSVGCLNNATSNINTYLTNSANIVRLKYAATNRTRGRDKLLNHAGKKLGSPSLSEGKTFL